MADRLSRNRPRARDGKAILKVMGRAVLDSNSGSCVAKRRRLPVRADTARSQLLALGAVALLATRGAAPTAQASVLKGIWGPAERNGVSLFPIYRELGDTLFEEDLHWNAIAKRRPNNPRNPSSPAYVWPAEVSSAVARAKHYDMQVALQIIGSPRWANGGRPPRWAPRRPSDFADFAIAASRRYPSVHLWMIWGTRACSTPPTGRSRASARPTW